MLQGKKLTISAADDKIWAFKKKSEFWKTWTAYQNLDCFPIPKDFLDEINGHINECDLLNTV